jgi:hypothetical protein
LSAFPPEPSSRRLGSWPARRAGFWEGGIGRIGRIGPAGGVAAQRSRWPKPWHVGWPMWEASEAVCQLPVLHSGCHPSAPARSWGNRSKDALATKCGPSPVAGASLLRDLGTHSRPSNPLQATSPMWEAHRVRRSCGRGGCGPIHAQSGEPGGQCSGLSPSRGVAAHGAPPTFWEAPLGGAAAHGAPPRFWEAPLGGVAAHGAPPIFNEAWEGRGTRCPSFGEAPLGAVARRRTAGFAGCEASRFGFVGWSR